MGWQFKKTLCRWTKIRKTDTEQRYTRIEKEMLSFVFSVEKFLPYIYGRKTDHNPLEAIVIKSFEKMTKWLQRMLLYT